MKRNKRKKEKARNTSLALQSQETKTLGEAFQQKYDNKSHIYEDIIRKLVTFIGSCNIPNSLVEKEELLYQVEPEFVRKLIKCCLI